MARGYMWAVYTNHQYPFSKPRQNKNFLLTIADVDTNVDVVIIFLIASLAVAKFGPRCPPAVAKVGSWLQARLITSRKGGVSGVNHQLKNDDR
jgi:hypothetical protein